jgi:hypothetical protein
MGSTLGGDKLVTTTFKNRKDHAARHGVEQDKKRDMTEDQNVV